MMLKSTGRPLSAERRQEGRVSVGSDSGYGCRDGARWLRMGVCRVLAHFQSLWSKACTVRVCACVHARV